MGLETGTYVGDLVITNPTSSDPKSQGDDHLRLIKSVLRESFAGFTGAVIVTGTDGGAADAYTLTPTTALAAYVNRMVALFIPAATNTTTTPTLNISGLGAKTIKRFDGTAVVAGDLSGITLAEYDGTNFRLIAVTKNYVDQQAFSAALPAQTGNDDKILGTTGTAAGWISTLKDSVINFVNGSDTTKKLAFALSGITTGTTRTVTIPDKSGTMAMTSDTAMVLVATLTPTAAANVDFLSTFTSTYDNYMVVFDRLLPASTGALYLRMAVAGAADSSSNYYINTFNNTSTTTAVAQANVTNASVYQSGQGQNGVMWICNVNNAAGHKSMLAISSGQDSATPSFAMGGMGAVFTVASVVTGFRLFWSSGGNFQAVGNVLVYGIKNT